MLSERDIVAKVKQLTVTRLRVWVRQGWIRPAPKAKEGFTEADMARAALIRDLEDKLGFGEEEVPVLLSLIDQIHGLRTELKTVLEALDDLPDDLRATVKMRIAARKRSTRR
jgi:chaperone modulatory protein CbpM